MRRFDPIAPAQRGEQPQHGGSGHARNRSTERESQPFDRCGERGADGIEVRRALQRLAGAPQGRHHAQQRPQHAQQHEQANQIRRQRRSRHGDALTLDAQPHRIAQARMDRLEPHTQARRSRGQARDGPRQRISGLTVAPQLKRARNVASAHQQRHGQRQRIRADVAHPDPAYSGQTGQKNSEINQILGHSVPVTGCEGVRRAASSPSTG